MAGFDISQLNEGQRSVVARLDEPLFVAAGAGSGKTFTLTARLVHALSKGSAADGGRYLDSVDQALVITFTDAAALEIKERVRQALRSAGEDDPFLREEALKVDGAWISTIHGMCSRILHRHAIELGIDPAFSVCEGSVADALKARALDEVMSEVQRDDAYEALRNEYPLWGSAPTGATSVVGMIDVLRGEAAKCLHGFDDLVCPQSNQTPSEMRRVTAAFEALASIKMTPKQLATTMATLESLRVFEQLPPGERTAARACEALEGAKVPGLTKPEQLDFKSDAKEALHEAVVVAQYERVQELAPMMVELARRVDERYGQLKHERSYLDNNDLIALALRAVEGIPEVRRDYAGRFRLVMIDEFQDTDELQLRLISLLSGRDACHLTTVGDAQQSIYRFRGGDVEVFRARGKGVGAQHHVAMDVNYRSDHSVLALVEKVCGDGRLLDDFLKLAADGGRKSRYSAQAVSGVPAPRIRLEVASGGTSELMSATLAAQIADRLALYRDQGQPVGSMALLLGTTTKVGLYLDALRARGLQAVVTGGSSFSSTPEVAVIQALLHTLSNPHDTQTGLFALLSSDMFRLDADDFCQLGTRKQEVLEAPTKRPVEQCFIDGELVLYGNAQPSARLRLAHEVLSRAFSRMGRWQLADVCQAVVEESGWLNRLEQEGINGLSVAANVLAAVRYVRELTVGLGLGAARAADEFDRWLEAAKITPANLVGEQVDAVKVMTIHGSKGLQFAVTAVAECWGNPKAGGRVAVGRLDGRCHVCMVPRCETKPYGDAKTTYADHTPLEARECRSVADWAYFLNEHEVAALSAEKARLLYVALTRAEEALVVGLPLSAQKGYLSKLARGMLDVFPELDELDAGEREIAVTPASPIECEYREQDETGVTARVRRPVQEDAGVVRTVMLWKEGKGADAVWLARSAGSLPGFDGQLPNSVTQVPLLGVEGSAEAAGAGRKKRAFELYHIDTTRPMTSAWAAREGVFSYSSAHALMEEAAGAHADAAFAEAGAVTAPAEQEASATGKQRKQKLPPTPPQAQQEAEAEGSPYTDDADKATNLGSAFHELAQSMVETSREHSPERLEALSRTWNLSKRQVARLQAAIARWEGSELRREALGYKLLRAEVPFFVRVDSRYGKYVEGAIDLLACNPGSSQALVVDYKTGDVGLGVAQIVARHRMQANFYAWVLMDQGFEEVECAFCCVEVDDGEGGPVVVRYHFDRENPPQIG